MRRTLRQCICRHDFKCIAKHKFSQQNLWKCDKCKVYYVQHYGIGIGYYTKVPPLLEHWESINTKLKEGSDSHD